MSQAEVRRMSNDNVVGLNIKPRPRYSPPPLLKGHVEIVRGRHLDRERIDRLIEPTAR